MNSVQKSELSVSLQSGARGLEGLPSLNYYNVQKWESRFTLQLIAARNMLYMRKQFK